MDRLAKTKRLPLLPRGIWWLIWGLGLIIVPYFTYDITGRILWNQFKAKYERNGVSFRLEDTFRNPPPSQDFFKSDTMIRWMHTNGDPTWIWTPNPAHINLLTKFPKGTRAAVQEWQSGLPVDLSTALVSSSFASQPEENVAAHLLNLFAPADATFAQLATDSELQQSSKAEGIPMIGGINDFCKILVLRVQANLAAGNSDRAMDELIAGLRFSEHMRNLDNFVGFLVQMAVLGLLDDAVWEGFARQSWNPEQLQRLANAIDELTITRNFAQVAVNELTMFDSQSDANWRSESLKQLKSAITSGRPIQIRDLLVAMITPEGHTCLNAYTAGHFWEDVCFDESGTLLPEFTVENLERAQAAIHAHRSGGILRQFYGIGIPNLGPIGDTMLETRQFYDLARFACELETYRHQHGRYPTSANELGRALPQDRFLPEGSIVYEVTGDRYRLISVGADQTDDGGVPGADMVWRFAASDKD